ncbi:Glycosyl hydrolases family 35 [Amphibacillus marinus]|uniref:Glycosyl hydrolases family 35 n=1 Tax=Amphibacillus marinus TaxID=872970 RepID=A0A1H8H263_9BACI|nr:beta-galactosidase [Amphibacillus marinus]SEN50336.1 Glycosyl hydrolases family 35 [Amphibacillus marinus]
MHILFPVLGNKEVPKPLPFSGHNDHHQLGATSAYLTKDNMPWFPIMGEFHYTRYPEDKWLEQLYKMKAGGIEIVATYVIWIHHEEIAGEWKQSGQTDLIKFIKTCQQAGLYLLLRVGPWAHGEVRNGGFPDWLQHAPFEKRTDNPQYLAYVAQYFKRIYQACEGLLFKDNGPIIGVQIENEYGHAGGKNGQEGYQHMTTLKQMLVKTGFDVPYYTATAWGGAVVVDQEMLPVFGGYVDAPWFNKLGPLPANRNFLITPDYNDELIANDFNPDGLAEVATNVLDYPILTAELGGGLQVTKRRRLYVEADATEAQALCKLALGANLLGYYMYHGGTNPIGELSTFQESTATGSNTDVPVLSYDFQAPIGEYGYFHPSYGCLRKLHLFIKSFEQWLVAARPIFPTELVTNPEDTQALRYNIRYNDDLQGGFIFINNYQRHRQMKNHGQVSFTIELTDKSIETPPIHVAPGFKGIIPFQIKFGEALLQSTNASLLCQEEDGTIVFYHHDPEVAIVNFIGKVPKYRVITEEEANQGLYYNGQFQVAAETQWLAQDHHYLEWTETAEQVMISAEQIEESKIKQHFVLNLVYPEQRAVDYLLSIDFIGDRTELFLGEQLIADWFQIGTDWQVSLARFNFPSQLKLTIYQTRSDVYYEREIETGCQLKQASVQAVVRQSEQIQN